jgi:hypothetical protein
MRRVITTAIFLLLFAGVLNANPVENSEENLYLPDRNDLRHMAVICKQHRDLVALIRAKDAADAIKYILSGKCNSGPVFKRLQGIVRLYKIEAPDKRRYCIVRRDFWDDAGDIVSEFIGLPLDENEKNEVCGEIA